MQLVDAVMAAAAFAGLLGRFEDFRRESEGATQFFYAYLANPRHGS
jgi:hypothetical protein